MNPKPTKTQALPGIPEFACDEEEAVWLEGPEGRRYMAQAPLVPIRFVPKDPTLVPVTIRLPADLPNRLRRLAESRSMAYQTLARQWLLERCAEEEAKEARNAAMVDDLDPRFADWLLSLSPLDRQIIQLRVDGYNCTEVAARLGGRLSTKELQRRLISLNESLALSTGDQLAPTQAQLLNGKITLPQAA